ncbi:prealbumin-like fold domain-containing protein [Roseburia hominis]
MKRRVKQFAYLVLVFVALESVLLSGGANRVFAVEQNISSHMAQDGTERNVYEDRTRIAEKNEGMEQGENKVEEGDKEEECENSEKQMETEESYKIVEILGIDKENLMEFEAGTVTIEEALAMLPASTEVKLNNGKIVRVDIKWNYEYYNVRTERYHLEPVSEQYSLGLPVEELPYVDILLDGIRPLVAYDPNTNSTVKLDKSLGCTKDVLTYLESHQSTYLGTPYSHLGTGLTVNNCMVPGAKGSMNCTGFVAHVLKACGADLNKIPKRLPGHYLNASNWNDYAHSQSIKSYRFNTISEALKSGRLEKGDVIYFEPKDWSEGGDCHIGFFWGDNSSQNRFWHSDHKGNRISEIVAKTANSYVYLFKTNHEPQKGYLKLHKDSALGDITSGNSCYSLAGAVYTIYNKNQEGILSGKVGEVKTDQNGNTEAIELPLGTYYIKETEVPQGYQADDKIYTVKITAGATKATPVMVQVKDVPEYASGGINITKIVEGECTSTCPSLEGTEFTIRYFDGYYTKETLPDSATRTWVVGIRKDASGYYKAELNDAHLMKEVSDELYYVNQTPVLPYGTIAIQETKPAAGYTLKGYLTDAKGNRIASDSEVYVSQVRKEAGWLRLNGGNVYTASDKPMEGSVRIRKYDVNGTSPLKGVTFEITNSKGKVVAEAATNQEGEAVFEHLYPDVYTITETKTVDGHMLLKDAITVEIPMQMTEKEVTEHKIDKDQCIYDQAGDIYYVYDLTYEISNDVSLEMPMTGGGYTVWTWVPMAAGMCLLCLASALVFRKKRL